MKPLRGPKKGEVVKLGPPALGEVTITVDPSRDGTAFAAGTETLLPGAEIPVRKHLDQDLVLFVHRGQGRVVLNGQALVVVPGAMLHVPRGGWHGLRNTGTGTFQFVWVSSPPGLEAFFRDLSRVGTASPAALQELAHRHRVEFQSATSTPVSGDVSVSAGTPAPTGRPRRKHRGGRRHHGGRRTAPAEASRPAPALPAAPVKPSSTAPIQPATSPAPSATPPTPSAPTAPGRHRRRRRGGKGRRSVPSAVSHGRREPAGGAPATSAPLTAQGPARPAGGSSRQRPPRGRSRRRAKEVYLGGRWVRIEGDEPVIDLGQHGPKQRGDDEPPHGRLSVQL